MTLEVASKAPSSEEQEVPEPLVYGGARSLARNKRVLVIYGRDESNCMVLCEFLESLGLHPRTFRDLASATQENGLTPDATRRIFRSVQATVILLTPDDETQMARHLSFGLGDVEHRRVRGQARASVYFEAGLAFGQAASQTTVLDLGVSHGSTHPDLGHLIEADATLDWQEALVSRLMECGCAVELDRRLDRVALQRFSVPGADDLSTRRLRFDEVEWALESVIEQVRGWRTPDCVIGINRGGGIVAAMLAETFRLESIGYLEAQGRRAAGRLRFEWRGGPPREISKKNATLLVGDVLRNRDEMIAARAFVSEQVKPQLRTATLASCCVTRSEHTPKERPVPDFLGLSEINEGGVFLPWESSGKRRRR